jgi:hypothetical protein
MVEQLYIDCTEVWWGNSCNLMQFGGVSRGCTVSNASRSYKNHRQYRRDNYMRRPFWTAIMQRIKLKPCHEETLVMGIVIPYLCVTVTQDV